MNFSHTDAFFSSLEIDKVSIETELGIVGMSKSIFLGYFEKTIDYKRYVQKTRILLYSSHRLLGRYLQQFENKKRGCINPEQKKDIHIFNPSVLSLQ
jgi:hypothetical protein